jgi:hypothetical protein
LRLEANAAMWVTTARTAGDASVTSDLMLDLSDVGTLWGELHGMTCTSNLVYAELRLTNR